jgi:hypothetical protein
MAAIVVRKLSDCGPILPRIASGSVRCATGVASEVPSPARSGMSVSARTPPRRGGGGATLSDTSMRRLATLILAPRARKEP